MNDMIKRCPMCNKDYKMILPKKLENKAESYTFGIDMIQDLVPEMTPAEREFVKSGYCMDCQEWLFGNGEHNFEFVELED